MNLNQKLNNQKLKPMGKHRPNETQMRTHNSKAAKFRMNLKKVKAKIGKIIPFKKKAVNGKNSIVPENSDYPLGI